MRLFSLTVCRNEEKRYLSPWLFHHWGIIRLFEAFFYDDQSTDNTRLMLMMYGMPVVVRPNDVPSFLDDEGAFRAAAWKAFEDFYHPEPGDWVFVLDCDEIVVLGDSIHQGDIADQLYASIEGAEKRGGKAFRVSIPEVFGTFPDGAPGIRTDALWQAIQGIRLVRYQPDARFQTGVLGAAPVPSYAIGAQWHDVPDLYLMHYGYAREEDRKCKAERYQGRPGHSSTHIDSILQTPTLVRWPGPYVGEMSEWATRST